MVQMHQQNASRQADPVICFAVEREGSGTQYTCVFASDEASARARVAPLFPGCDLIPIDSSQVYGLRG